MKKVKYLGGGWTDKRTTDPKIFQLTIGKVYEVEHEGDDDYAVVSDVSEHWVYEYKRFFTVVKDKIHNPEQIEVGKLYKSPIFGNNVLYMGCKNYDTKKKFLLIVVDDDNDSDVGVMVSMDLNMPIWKSGFELAE